MGYTKFKYKGNKLDFNYTDIKNLTNKIDADGWYATGQYIGIENANKLIVDNIFDYDDINPNNTIISFRLKDTNTDTTDINQYMKSDRDRQYEIQIKKDAFLTNYNDYENKEFIIIYDNKNSDATIKFNGIKYKPVFLIKNNTTPPIQNEEITLNYTFELDFNYISTPNKINLQFIIVESINGTKGDNIANILTGRYNDNIITGIPNNIDPVIIQQTHYTYTYTFRKNKNSENFILIKNPENSQGPEPFLWYKGIPAQNETASRASFDGHTLKPDDTNELYIILIYQTGDISGAAQRWKCVWANKYAPMKFNNPNNITTIQLQITNNSSNLYI